MNEVATVNGSNGHKIYATVLLKARGTPLNGMFVTIQTGCDLILGRIVEVRLNNPMHDNDLFAPTIMAKGNIPFYSGEVDIERAEIEIIAMLDTEKRERIPIRRNAPSGTAIMSSNQEAIDQFSLDNKYKLILGYIPNSGGLTCSIINRNFGPQLDISGKDLGGYGEARHVAILGQNGSGKTVLLTMELSGRICASPQMGLLMPDLSGDLADPTRHDRGTFRWNYAKVLDSCGILLERISIDEIKLTSPFMLMEKLKQFLYGQLPIASEKAEQLARVIVFDNFEGEVDSSVLNGEWLINEIIAKIGERYAGKGEKVQKQDEAQRIKDNPLRMARFNRELGAVCKLFDGRFYLSHLVRDVLENGRKVIIEMESLNESDHGFVMSEIMDQLNKQARIIYRAGKQCNSIVVLDEAQRFVPEGEDNSLSEKIKAGFRETRKYGVGWVVVAQSPAGVSKKVLRECHTTYCGANLGIGADEDHLKSILTPNGVEMYNQLQIQGGYFWVASGKDNNIATGKSFFAFHPFGGNATSAFMQANPHIFPERTDHTVYASSVLSLPSR